MYTVEKLFGIDECIKFFNEEFFVLGSNSSMFTDYSWYKDVDFNRNKSFLNQFYKKRHNLMHLKLQETILDEEKINKLFLHTEDIRIKIKNLEKDCNSYLIDEIINSLDGILEIVYNFDKTNEIGRAIKEVITLFKIKDLKVDDVKNCNEFKTAFGRGQQYISLVKK